MSAQRLHGAAAIVAVATLMAATWPSAQVPAGHDDAAAPRATSGDTPDLSGIWQAVGSAAWDIQGHAARKGVPGGIGVVVGHEIPYQPWALEKRRAHAMSPESDPEAKCYLPGVPRITYMPFPFQIVQTPEHIALLYEYIHAVRTVYMNSAHPQGPIEFWMGDSRGHWEGDTLVVDVVHFNADTWFDRSGNFHSEELHVVERYTPRGPNHLRYDVAIEDPKVFTRPWRMSMPLYRRIDTGLQLLEYECYAFDDEFHVSPPS